MSLAAQIKRITEVSQERAYEIIATLTEKITTDTHATRIVTGLSAEYGPVHVVIPPLGDAVILPFAIHD